MAFVLAALFFAAFVFFSVVFDDVAERRLQELIEEARRRAEGG